MLEVVVIGSPFLDKKAVPRRDSTPGVNDEHQVD